LDISSVKIIKLIANAQNLESWIAIDNEENIVGHIFMLIETDNKIKFLDAWVDEKHRRKGIFRKLWEVRWKYVKKNYSNWTVYAWCKDSSLPLLIEKGFTPGEIVTYVEKKVK
jgi:hypothetical protein